MNGGSLFVVGGFDCRREAICPLPIFSGTDDVSDVFELIAEECSLIHLDTEASFGEGFEHFANVTYGFLDFVRINDEVTYID